MFYYAVSTSCYTASVTAGFDTCSTILESYSINAHHETFYCQSAVNMVHNNFICIYLTSFRMTCRCV